MRSNHPSARSGRPARGWIGVLTSAFLLLSAASAPAARQPESPAEIKARELVRVAQDFVARGDMEEALVRYRTALETAPAFHLARFELARVLAYVGRYEESAGEFAAVVAALPENGAARRGEATALLFLGRYGEAREKLAAALEALPRDGQLAHTLARVLATAPVDRVRDGQLALQLALAVYEVKKTFETAETVTMAYAEVGEYARAIELQRRLIGEAEAAGDETRVEELRERLLAYLRSEPWRAASPAEIVMATEPPAPGR